MHVVPSEPSLAVIAGDFDGMNAVELFQSFTEPEKLVQWWPAKAEVELQVGGKYHFYWPDPDYHLRGEYLAIVPGRHLAFTWDWDHDPARPSNLRVDMWLDRIHEKGTRLAIYQGHFPLSPEGIADRNGAIEGWIHFCMKLGGLAPGAVD